MSKPEDLWIVEWPPGVTASWDKIGRAKEAEKLLGGLVDIAKGGSSETLFVVLLDAQVRCREFVKAIEASDKEARAESLRAELSELEGLPAEPWPTVFARVLWELSGRTDENTRQLAWRLAAMAGDPQGLDPLENRLNDADAEHLGALTGDIADALHLSDDQRTRLAYAYA